VRRFFLKASHCTNRPNLTTQETNGEGKFTALKAIKWQQSTGKNTGKERAKFNAHKGKVRARIRAKNGQSLMLTKAKYGQEYGQRTGNKLS